MDCPVNVMLSAGDCGQTATPMANTMARQVAGSSSRPHFRIVVICVFLQGAIFEKIGVFRGTDDTLGSGSAGLHAGRTRILLPRLTLQLPSESFCQQRE